MAYHDVMRQRVSFGAERLTLMVKAGMVDWSEIEVATMLLAEAVPVSPGMRVLILEGGGGALAVWAARQGAEVHLYDGNAIAGQMARQTLAANQVSGVTVHEAAFPAAEDEGAFDLAMLLIPKGRAYTRVLLGAACQVLKPGGQLYLAGPNAAGAKAIVKDAGEILGQASTIRTKARNRVALAIRQPEADGTGALAAVGQPLTAGDLTLFSAPGVFSWDGLDDGTAMLLATLDAGRCAGQRVLDLGCGSGVIGLTTARLGASAVDLIDVSWLAVAMTQRGITANGFADRARAWVSDLYAGVDEPAYDMILSNPPFHAGHKVNTEAAEALIRGAHDRLNRRGTMRIVANRFIPYDRLLRDVFGRVSIKAEDPRYWVLEATR